MCVAQHYEAQLQHLEQEKADMVERQHQASFPTALLQKEPSSLATSQFVRHLTPHSRYLAPLNSHDQHDQLRAVEKELEGAYKDLLDSQEAMAEKAKWRESTVQTDPLGHQMETQTPSVQSMETQTISGHASTEDGFRIMDGAGVAPVVDSAAVTVTAGSVVADSDAGSVT